MKIAITGGSGFLGNVLLRKLASTEHSGNVLRHEQNISFLPKNFTSISGDVRRPDSLDNLCANMDVLIHCASHISILDHSFPKLIETNIQGTKNVIDGCARHGVKRLIHVSSSHAYENHQGTVLNEQSPFLMPTNEHSFYPPYDLTKMESQKLAAQASEHIPSLETIVLVPSGIIGPSMGAPLSLMGKALMDMYTGDLPASIKGGYHFVDVRDIADMIVASVDMNFPNKNQSQNKAETFLLSSQLLPVPTAARIVHECGGHTPPWFTVSPNFLFPWVGLVRGLAQLLGQEPLYTRSSLFVLSSTIEEIDCSRAKKMLDFRPRPLFESIRDAISCFIQEGRVEARTQSPIQEAETNTQNENV